MASGTIYGTCYDSDGDKTEKYQFYAEYSTGTQSIASNYTPVTVVLKVRRNPEHPYAASAYNLNGVVDVSLSIDGSVVYSTSSADIDTRNAKVWKFTTKTKNVGHNDDGTKTVSIKASFSGVSVNSLKKGSLSGSVKLDTIPRVSEPTVSASSVKMGNSVTIYTNRKATSLTHTLTYSFAGETGTIATGVGDSYKWTVPDMASKIFDKTSDTCTITCKTYSGTTLIGSDSTTLTLAVPDATVPKLSASTVAMGSKITISLARKSDAYTHSLSYSLKEYGGSTAIATGTIGNYTEGDIDWTVPLSLAAKIPSDTKATVTITCQTWFEGGSTAVGTESASFTATVPNNSTTQPKVTMTLSPVDSPFSGVYVAGKSKVKVSYEASSSYSTIKSYLTELLSYSSSANPYTSPLLSNSGTVAITGKVTDARGYSATKNASITVIEYSRPRIIPGENNNKIICTRCNSDGTTDPGGVYLLIQIGRKYSKVVSGGTQKNYCKLSYRYKTDADDDSGYSAPVTLLARTATSDYVDVVLSGIVSSNTTAYNIQLIAEDDVGEKDTVTITIPTAFATWHSPVGGHGFTLGGYHDPSKYDVFDCRFDAEFEGDVTGKALGLGKVVSIPEDSDFNDYKDFNTYAVTQNAKAETISNMPVQKAGILRVWSANGLGVTTGNYVYIIQEFVVYDNSATYRRSVMLENDVWKYGVWKVTDGADVVIDHGATDGWYWRKFANGTAECWLRVTQTVDVSTAWGSLFYGAAQVVTFPFTFASVPVCNISCEYQAAGNPSVMVASNGRSTTTQAANILLVRPTANSAVDCVVVYHAIGRWK